MTVSAGDDTLVPDGGVQARRNRPTRPSLGVWAAALGMLLAAGAAIGLMMQARSTHLLDIDEIGSLSRAGKQDLALVKVEAYLRTSAANSSARVLAAELALESSDPRPATVLEHLVLVNTTDPALLARAQVARGKAFYLQQRYDDAEASWLDALRLDPLVPEAAWALLDLHYLEGREDEVRRLALAQHEIEPDARDRVGFLVELIRQEVQPPDPASLVARFEPAVRAQSDALRPSLVLGVALVKSSRAGQGLEFLLQAVSHHPDRLEAWQALLTGLESAGEYPRLAEYWNKAPAAFRSQAGMARHEGNAAQARGDWAAAAAAYRRAWEADPGDMTAAYRLARSLHAEGRHKEAAEFDRIVQAAGTARSELPGLHQEISSVCSQGKPPPATLCERLAQNRHTLGRHAEARAWHKLAVEALGGDSYGTAASKRLESPESRTTPVSGQTSSPVPSRPLGNPLP
jgi:tetratricopeptide (TPR) repeat protein